MQQKFSSEPAPIYIARGGRLCDPHVGTGVLTGPETTHPHREQYPNHADVQSNETDRDRKTRATNFLIFSSVLLWS
jgi:hypothetical protein